VTGYCRRWHDAILQLEGGKDMFGVTLQPMTQTTSGSFDKTGDSNRRSAELTVKGLLAQIAKTRVTPRSRGLFLNRLINTSPTRLRCLTMINEKQRIKVAGARALKLLSLTRTDAIAFSHFHCR
jgi:hypothetical protein